MDDKTKKYIDDKFVEFEKKFTIQSKKIANNPTDAFDVANKRYVDNNVFGVSPSSTIGFYGVTKVTQAGAISNPSGGATIDSQARTAINSIILASHNIGIIG